MRFEKFVTLLLVLVTACKKDHPVSAIAKGFEDSPVAKPLTPGIADEASGVADSKANPGYLWVQQDSGNPSDIALFSHDGGFLKKINIDQATNRDWEDMALANGPVFGTNYIYLADIGDNNLVSTDYFIYRFAEPAASASVVSDVDKIIFQYPDGSHNAEAILVDNNTKDIYIITKQDEPSRIYKLAYPQSTSTINTASLAGSLSFTGVTSATASPDGREVFVKTYSAIWKWEKSSGQTMEQALAGTPVTLNYQFEPQGEAICFKNDNTGFFTLSEKPSVIAAVNLNFYKRK
ncbi:MAG: hypothetical protein ABI675_02190 [Chitinophagaceae bacterium]